MLKVQFFLFISLIKILFISGLDPALVTRLNSLTKWDKLIAAKCTNTDCSSDQCVFEIVESIPEGLTYPEGSPSHTSIYSSWEKLLHVATQSIDIASSYWSLRGTDINPWNPSSQEGDAIFKFLLDKGNEEKVPIRIVQSVPTKEQPDADTQELVKMGAAEVRSLDFDRLVGAGILHTKMWLVDDRHFYVGSANLDWRSLTQVKELGVMVYNCTCLAADMRKIFEAYWYLATPNSSIPHPWPSTYSTQYNIAHPMPLKFNNSMSGNVYLASSPPEICATGRSSDIDAIINIIESAQEYICIAVMDYAPSTLYRRRMDYWPRIDDALRRAAVDRGVHIRLLASWWNHSRSDMINFMASLAALDGVNKAVIETKLFTVPCFTPSQCEIPFARVNHNKYMVTDQVAYIGTSNWSEDYFVSTGGIGFVVNETSTDHQFRSELYQVFKRDWFSTYSKPVTCFH